MPTDAALAPNVTSGSLAVDASVSLTQQPPAQCPGVASFSISPAEIVASGQSSALSVVTVGPPAAITWWIASGPAGGATLGDSSATDTTFACSMPGTYEVEVTAGLPGSSACNGVGFTSMSASIACEPNGLVVNASIAGATTTFHAGSLPAPTSPQTVTVPATRVVGPNSLSPIDLSSTSPFTTVYVSDPGPNGTPIGYWEIDLGGARWMRRCSSRSAIHLAAVAVRFP